MTRYFYDCEFLEDGRTIDLISIGMVAEDGREYYAVHEGTLAMWARVDRHPWLVKNVRPHLPGTDIDVVTSDGEQKKAWVADTAHPDVKPTRTIANEVRQFLLSGDGKPELWAWYAAYDHVALCQLWGPMINLPKGIPMYTGDLKQECDRLGNPPLPEQPDGEHNALADARHNLVRAQHLNQLAAVMSRSEGGQDDYVQARGAMAGAWSDDDSPEQAIRRLRGG